MNKNWNEIVSLITKYDLAKEEVSSLLIDESPENVLDLRTKIKNPAKGIKIKYWAKGSCISIHKHRKLPFSIAEWSIYDFVDTYLIWKEISIRIKNIPTFFEIGIFLTRKANENLLVKLAIGNIYDNICETIDNSIVLELAKDFIIKGDKQIIDYLQDQDYEMGKLLNT